MEMGEHTLILDRSFKQSVRLEGEKAHLSAEPSGIRADLAIPITDCRSYLQTEPDLLFDNVVAIDLGERRIGYAIFSLTKFVESGCQDPFEVGSVAIPTFRKLHAAVRRHRGSRQPNQKVGQTYSKALMQFRENVVGDVCNRIDTLCERFRGFPILESSVGNFETGGRQLEMIYGSVLRRYVDSKVDAHKTFRRQHWFTADTWEHPYVLPGPGIRGKNSIRVRPSRCAFFRALRSTPPAPARFAIVAARTRFGRFGLCRTRSQ